MRNVIDNVVRVAAAENNIDVSAVAEGYGQVSLPSTIGFTSIQGSAVYGVIKPLIDWYYQFYNTNRDAETGTLEILNGGKVIVTLKLPYFKQCVLRALVVQTTNTHEELGALYTVILNKIVLNLCDGKPIDFTDIESTKLSKLVIKEFKVFLKDIGYVFG